MADKDTGQPEEQNWNPQTDMERRKGPRRTGHDRRDMVRFEPDKEDRRSGKDRRGGPDFWGTDDPI